MYPFFELFSWILVYTFGITLTLCFFVFVWNLERLAKRFWYSFSFFSQNILWFVLSTFIFSRAFYVIWKWQDMKFIKDPFQFFIMSEFNFSLYGAIFWFLLVLYILVRLEKSSITRYIDGVVLSFLFVAVIGYIGTLFGWQVYGRETMLWIEISYTHPYTPVPFQVPVFPLPIIYALWSFLIFSSLYIVSLFLHIRWYIGYLWIILFSAMILVFESFSWKQDILSVNTLFNLPQIYALIAIIASGIALYKLFGSDTKSSKDQHIV